MLEASEKMNPIPSRKWKYRENDTQSDLTLGSCPLNCRHYCQIGARSAREGNKGVETRVNSVLMHWSGIRTSAMLSGFLFVRLFELCVKHSNNSL